VLENSRLGSMGVPIKLLVQGRPVFVCCKGCLKQARDNAEKTLRRLDERKSGKQGKPAPEDRRAQEEAEIRAELAKLSPEDRRLAEEQVFCAAQKENSRLGSMGVPLKLMIRGQPAFVCCDGCAKEARDHPAQTLATVERLRTKAKAAPPGR
jgi:hypothetical protein